MTQLFISYSRKDINVARRLAGDLEKAGYVVWWDITDLRGGDDWPRAIPAAIEASQIFIIVLSPNSAVSDWVEKEYTHALSLRTGSGHDSVDHHKSEIQRSLPGQCQQGGSKGEQ